jgi:histidinol-phosphate/aromatic aminotransferase/cobyric acid decarboxylase-like protein
MPPPPRETIARREFSAHQAHRIDEPIVALAERHGVSFDEVTVCAGADAVIGYAAYATLDPGDEVVTGWPSFPSYVLDPLKMGAVSPTSSSSARGESWSTSAGAIAPPPSSSIVA